MVFIHEIEQNNQLFNIIFFHFLIIMDIFLWWVKFRHVYRLFKKIHFFNIFQRFLLNYHFYLFFFTAWEWLIYDIVGIIIFTTIFIDKRVKVLAIINLSAIYIYYIFNSSIIFLLTVNWLVICVYVYFSS